MIWLPSAPCRALEIRYSISMPQPWDHYFDLQINLNGLDRETVDLQMPAWSPGRYSIRNFSRNVRDFSARAREPLPVKKIDKQTWRIEAKDAQSMDVSYKVYADNLDGAYSQLNDFHAFLDGASLYMYVVGHKDNPVSLTVEKPDGWMILSSAGDLGQTQFAFPNYDLMIDHLVQLGLFFVEEFKIGPTVYRVSLLNNGDRRYLPAFVDKIRRLQETAVPMLGAIPQDRYTFFFHFLPDSRNTAGMEHLDACQITRNHDTSDSGDAMDLTYWIAAHELVHAWNVKRLRPQGLGPFDYTQEVYTPLLWLAEGCTSYLANLVMKRAGLWNKEKFYNRFADDIRQFRATPGIFQRSAEQSSFDAWLQDKGTSFGESDWDNVWISYYTKGELIGLCMDIEIRHRTRNRKSFEDFMQLLYQRFYVDAPAESYYLPGRGYTTQDVLQTLEDLTGGSWQEFYDKLIASPGDIPLNDYLTYAGLQLLPKEEKDPTPYTGLHLGYGPSGQPRIDGIDYESPAHQAGLSRHDVLIAFDGERAMFNDYKDVLRRRAIDEEILITLLRDDRLLEKKLRLKPGWNEVEYQLRENEKSSPLEKRILRQWLGEKERKKD